MSQATLRFGESRRGESYVNRVVVIGARFRGRYHCGLDRRAWICTDAPDRACDLDRLGQRQSLKGASTPSVLTKNSCAAIEIEREQAGMRSDPRTGCWSWQLTETKTNERGGSFRRRWWNCCIMATNHSSVTAICLMQSTAVFL